MKDGQTYRNSYAWFFRMRAGRVIAATAFLDLPTYDAALSGDPLPPWPAA
jgi:ketosteroid isomerase-like protein